jgi:U3 small nucleolar RNA-associated protein 20
MAHLSVFPSCLFPRLTELILSVPAQLKVNLRPLWSPAATALGSLSQRFGDVVWRLLFAELHGVSREQQPPSSWPEKGQEESEESNDEDPWEEERSWRDPSAHKLRSVVLQWSDSEFAKKQLYKVSLPNFFLKTSYLNFSIGAKTTGTF